jgi:benzoyl-CoA-dihydrodiol lyase
VPGVTASSEPLVDFERFPENYRHWSLVFDGPMAVVSLDVDPFAGFGSYELKLNSYDLSVDVELADIVQRLRFEHPEVAVVVLTSALDKVFSAGANIQMLAGATHHHKVNFCKFTNETRNAIEDASRYSGQVWIAAIDGAAAGGGYELALACEEIILVDDRSSAVSLPEVPLLGVLPGTGGLTRLVDKRHVRRDVADAFCTRIEGVKGQHAVELGLVDSSVAPTRFAEHLRERALARAAESDRPGAPDAQPVSLPSLATYRYVGLDRDLDLGTVTVTLRVPSASNPDEELGSWWMLTAAREIDDAILRLRFNEPELGTWVLRTVGEIADVLTADELLRSRSDHWFYREVRLLWKRVLKRLDVSARSLVTLVEPGSCFAGTLAELVFASDKSYMLDGSYCEGSESSAKAPSLHLSEANDGWYPMSNSITRLESRYYGHDGSLEAVRERFGAEIAAGDALELGLVTAAPDDIDWNDEVRLALEERAAFSPDALTAMEANLRFVGPETMESKIFGRLTAWQNWVFQRPNAVGPSGALRRYGSGSRPEYDNRRV